MGASVGAQGVARERQQRTVEHDADAVSPELDRTPELHLQTPGEPAPVVRNHVAGGLPGFAQKAASEAEDGRQHVVGVLATLRDRRDALAGR